jgi:hypothetical protein
MIGAGTDWAGHIDAHLESADLILLLISAAFLASQYCYDLEMDRALDRHEAGTARAIPVILKPVFWEMAPSRLRALEALPTDARPVTTWRNTQEAFVDVVKGIRDAIQQIDRLSFPRRGGDASTPHSVLRPAKGRNAKAESAHESRIDELLQTLEGLARQGARQLLAFSTIRISSRGATVECTTTSGAEVQLTLNPIDDMLVRQSVRLSSLGYEVHTFTLRNLRPATVYIARIDSTTGDQMSVRFSTRVSGGP